MPDNSCAWRAFVEEKSYELSVGNCGGYERNDEVTLVAGWALGNKPECYDKVSDKYPIRILQTVEITWKNPPIPPMRIFFQIKDDDNISLLYIEEDK